MNKILQIILIFFYIIGLISFIWLTIIKNLKNHDTYHNIYDYNKKKFTSIFLKFLEIYGYITISLTIIILFIFLFFLYKANKQNMYNMYT